MHLLKIKTAIISMFFTLAFSPIFSESQEIPFYTYHTHAPFILNEQTGLSYDLAEYLENKSYGLYSFNVIPMSRSRVNKMLEQEKVGIIPWINPAWFADFEEQLYMWTEGILMEDGSSIISNINTRLEYEGPESILDLKFGGIREHQYVVIDDLVQKGELVRVDSENHIDNFRKLLKNRIDFTITPTTGALYLLKSNNMIGELYISTKPHSTFSRRIIIPSKDQKLKEFLEDTIINMSSDPQWQDIQAKYK